MKKILLSTLLLALPLLASAYDIAVKNDDGVTIYYNYTNDDETEVKVTYGGDYYYSSDIKYSGDVKIPGEVNYNGKTLPVTSIGSCTFFNDPDLTSVTIPNTVTSIGESAFNKCNGLASVNIPNSVTSIAWYAFEDCTSLTTLTIPHTVTSIGQQAFEKCTGLTTVVIGNSLNSLEYGLFKGCTNLASVTIGSSVNTIGESAFQNCTSLTSITIPNGVTAINDRAFRGCTGLTSMTIGKSVASIGEAVFSECTNLTTVVVESGNAKYDSRDNCNAIVETATNTLIQGCNTTGIPNSVTAIGNFAFSGCTRRLSVTIPKSVVSIGNEAFEGCNALINVISQMKSPCPIDLYCFHDDVFNNATLYVPKGTTDSYKLSDYWRKFITIKEFEVCATPTIAYGNKKLEFSCETEDVEYVYEIKDADVKIGYEAAIDLSATYEISVYATKEGLGDSDVATATLVWMDADSEGAEPIVTQANTITERVPVLISARDGMLTVKSELEGQSVSVYTLDGKVLGSARVKGGQAVIATNLPKGTIVVVKVGDRSVKVSL